MMTRTSLTLALLLLLPLRGFAEAPPPALQETAIKLFDSLTPEQKKESVLLFNSPEKFSMVFTGGKRPGVQIKTMSPEQQALAIELLTAFTSDYGKQKALAIAEQKPDNPDDDPGIGRYFVCFFGEVGKGKTFAWRIAEHHLTLVQVEVENGQPTTFGPILLGANPPVLWNAEEEQLIALFSVMTPEERAKAMNGGKGISSLPAPKGTKSIKAAELSSSAKTALKKMFDGRLKFFSEPVEAEIRRLLDSEGGLDGMQLSFFGEANKKCRDGGRWDFKLSSDKFLCDYEGTRGHIHLSLKAASPAETK